MQLERSGGIRDICLPPSIQMTKPAAAATILALGDPAGPLSWSAVGDLVFQEKYGRELDCDLKRR